MLNASERGHHIPNTYNPQNKLQKKSIRHIAQAGGYPCDAVERAIIGILRSTYRQSIFHPSPVAGPYYAQSFEFEPDQKVSFQQLLVCA